MSSAGVRSRASRLLVAGVAGVVVLAGVVAGPAVSAGAAPVGVPPSGVGGTVTAWGDDSAGETDVPASLDGRTVTAIAGGYLDSLALTSDGQVTGWGDDSYGQTEVPASLTGKTVTAIAAGANHSLALTSDGRVTAWGRDTFGQTEVPASLTGKTVTAIAAGANHSLALTSDGQITAWGENSSGETAVPASLTGKTVTAIAAGYFHNLALTSDGQVTAWGDDSSGEGDVPASLTGTTVTAIAVGADHNLALTSDGQVTAWGDDSHGQLDVPASLTGKTVTAIAAGGSHSMALTSDGQVTAWGNDTFGETDVPASLSGQPVTAIAAGGFHSLAVVGLPVVSLVSPQLGSTAGGTPVTGTGSGFTGASQVLFGDVAASGFTIDSDTQITATTPAHTSGGVKVYVQGPGGRSVIPPNAGRFRYRPGAVVSAVNPASGPVTGGQTVRISGSGLRGASGVSFGTIPATSYRIVSSTSLIATVPAATGPGTVDVAVSAPLGDSPALAADHYTYLPAPTIDTVQPTQGPTAGGTHVTVTGSGFTGASGVRFGGVAATSFTVNSDTRITAVTPAHIKGHPTIYIRTTGGRSITGPTYTYN